MGKKKKRTITKPQKRHTYKGKSGIRHFKIPGGLQTPDEIREEMEHMRNVLHGRVDPPLEKGVMTLMEVAEGYFSRACEIEQLILAGKAQGWLPKNKGYETLRTQEIRSFKELAKGATELGSRRITYEDITLKKELRGLESI